MNHSLGSSSIAGETMNSNHGDCHDCGQKGVNLKSHNCQTLHNCNSHNMHHSLGSNIDLLAPESMKSNHGDCSECGETGVNLRLHNCNSHVIQHSLGAKCDSISGETMCAHK